MRRLTAVLAVLMLTAVACGDDDDDKAAAPAAPKSTTTTRSPQVQQYCTDVLAIETAPEPDIDFESLSEAQVKAETKKYFQTTFLPLVNKVKAGYKPPETAADLDVLIAASERVGQTGEFKEFETPAAEAAEIRAHAYDLTNCGWAKADITAVDYAYQGAPTTLKPGPTSFDLRNSGKELHEIAVLRKKPGVTISFDDILKKDEKESKKDVDEVASGFAVQGKTDYGVGQLTPGDYAMVCFIPQGTTSEDTEGKGEPHFKLGMKAEFKVA